MSITPPVRVLTRPDTVAEEQRVVRLDAEQADHVRDLLSTTIGSGRWVLVANERILRQRDLLSRLCSRPPTRVLSGVRSHPRWLDLLSIRRGDRREIEPIMAIGGGSVIDAAKIFRALDLIGEPPSTIDATQRRLAEWSGKGPPLIVVPTTAGSGAEATPTATVWRDDGGKEALEAEWLRPTTVVMSRELLTTVSFPVLAAGGLDALGHALEAIWNRHATSASDAHAVVALGHLRDALEALPDDARRDARLANLQQGAYRAGCAIAITRTALAHAMSYPVTERTGLAHGFAVGLALPAVARLNMSVRPDRLSLAARGLGLDMQTLPTWLDGIGQRLGLAGEVARRVPRATLVALSWQLVHSSRAARNVVTIDGNQARELLLGAYDRLLFEADAVSSAVPTDGATRTDESKAGEK